MNTELPDEGQANPLDNGHLRINTALQALFDSCDVAAAVLAVTTDGYLVCEYKRTEANLNRLAAMASTLMSLGDAITDDVNMGACKNVICENETGIALFMHIHGDLVLTVLTYEHNSLGLLLSACRRSVESLQQFN